MLYERWRLEIVPVADDLLRNGSLTPIGTDFVTVLKERLAGAEFGSVPAETARIAREVALDHWLTWQLMHVTFDAAEVASLADAYQRSESLGGRALPEARIENDVRQVDSIRRSELLTMRFQNPKRYWRLAAEDAPGLGVADALLVGGDSEVAVKAYCEALADEPDPAAWIGLALAVHRLPAPPRSVFSTHLPLLHEMHASLARRGIQADPLQLAAWFG